MLLCLIKAFPVCEDDIPNAVLPFDRPAFLVEMDDDLCKCMLARIAWVEKLKETMGNDLFKMCFNGVLEGEWLDLERLDREVPGVQAILDHMEAEPNAVLMLTPGTDGAEYIRKRAHNTTTVGAQLLVEDTEMHVQVAPPHRGVYFSACVQGSTVVIETAFLRKDTLEKILGRSYPV